jgi:hypothetical protein
MNDTTLLLGLPGVMVERVEIDPDGAPVVHVRTADISRVLDVRGTVGVG